MTKSKKDIQIATFASLTIVVLSPSQIRTSILATKGKVLPILVTECVEFDGMLGDK